jgi:hypothetical protein
VFYEDYVTKLIEENERHREFLTKDYENFKPAGTAAATAQPTGK